jgi:hypothetical protein
MQPGISHTRFVPIKDDPQHVLQTFINKNPDMGSALFVAFLAYIALLDNLETCCPESPTAHI